MVVAVSGLVVALSTAVFGLVQAVLVQPLGFPEFQELVILGRTRPTAPTMFGASLPDYLDWREWTAPWLDDIGAYGTEPMAVVSASESVAIEVGVATPSLWSVLEVRPLLGRLLNHDDATRGAQPAALVTEQFWRGVLGGSSAVVGSTISLVGYSGAPTGDFEIVGVLPASVRLQFPSDPSVYVALATDQVSRAGFNNGLRRLAGYRVIGRLRDDISISTVAASLLNIRPTDYDSFTTNDRLSIRPLAEHVLGRSRNAVRAIAVATGLVLLVGSANLSSFLLTRVHRRRLDFATLFVLGAPRWSVFLGLITETVVMILAGSLLGIVFAPVLLNVIALIAPATLPGINAARVDWSAIVFAGGISLFFGTLAAALPSWRAGNESFTTTLASSTARAAMFRRILLSVQVAVVTWLMVTALWLLSSVWRFYSAKTGFDEAQVTVMQINPRFQINRENHLSHEMYTELLRQLSLLPGVERTSLMFRIPFGAQNRATIATHSASIPAVVYIRVLPSYFSAMGIQLLAGRDFNSSDARSVLTAVVSEECARRAFGALNPIGREITGPFGSQTVIGVVRDARYSSLIEPIEPTVYFPFGDRITSLPSVVVRWTVPPAQPRLILEPLFRSLLPAGVVVGDPVRLDRLIDQKRAGIRFVALLVVIFAAIAASLALSGIYAAVHSLAETRRREIAIRMAIGARTRHVAVFLMRDTCIVLAIGLAVGNLASLATSRAVSLAVDDIVTSGLVGAAFATTGVASAGLVASLQPVLSAVRIDLVRWLRPV
jgi:predicted permease